MPRVREFDSHDALEKAMRLFWEKGYSNTSIDDLVKATEVSRYGLYDEFDSKHGLFLASLEHYQRVIVTNALGGLEHRDASLPSVKRYFDKVLMLSSSDGMKSGCLMVNTANDVAPYDQKAASQVQSYRERLTLAFVAALTRAKDNHEISGVVNVEVKADFFVGVVQALSIMSRSHASLNSVKNVVTTALSCLEEL